MSFKESRIYPVLFIAGLSIFFVGMLAVLYEYTKPQVEKSRLAASQSAVLQVFGLPVNNVNQDYAKYIQAVNTTYNNQPYTYYKATTDTLLGYAFPVVGKGLWSNISALLAVTPDGKKIIGLKITDEAETPGLGGRIEEPWFTDQLKQKPLFAVGDNQNYVLVPEDNHSPKPNEIRQITGATLSSNAIKSMLRDEAGRIMELLKPELNNGR